MAAIRLGLLVFWLTAATAQDGYLLDNRESSFAFAAEGGERVKALQCPSDNVIETRYRCKSPDGHWTDCSRRSCCPGHTLIMGRCLPDSADPCGLGLCEQR